MVTTVLKKDKDKEEPKVLAARKPVPANGAAPRFTQPKDDKGKALAPTPRTSSKGSSSSILKKDPIKPGEKRAGSGSGAAAAAAAAARTTKLPPTAGASKGSGIFSPDGPPRVPGRAKDILSPLPDPGYSPLDKEGSKMRMAAIYGAAPASASPAALDGGASGMLKKGRSQVFSNGRTSPTPAAAKTPGTSTLAPKPPTRLAPIDTGKAARDAAGSKSGPTSKATPRTPGGASTPFSSSSGNKSARVEASASATAAKPSPSTSRQTVAANGSGAAPAADATVTVAPADAGKPPAAAPSEKTAGAAKPAAAAPAMVGATPTKAEPAAADRVRPSSANKPPRPPSAGARPADPSKPITKADLMAPLPAPVHRPSITVGPPKAEPDTVAPKEYRPEPGAIYRMLGGGGLGVPGQTPKPSETGEGVAQDLPPTPKAGGHGRARRASQVMAGLNAYRPSGRSAFAIEESDGTVPPDEGMPSIQEGGAAGGAPGAPAISPNARARARRASMTIFPTGAPPTSNRMFMVPQSNEPAIIRPAAVVKPPSPSGAATQAAPSPCTAAAADAASTATSTAPPAAAAPAAPAPARPAEVNTAPAPVLPPPPAAKHKKVDPDEDPEDGGGFLTRQVTYLPSTPLPAAPATHPDAFPGFEADPEYVGQLPGYTLGKVIGEGGFCQVRLAMHHLSRRRVAVKVVDKLQLNDEMEKRRIVREIRIMKHLSHPCIIKIFEVIDTPAKQFIIQEYASRGSLLDFVRARKKLSEFDACYFFQQIVASLQACHRRSVVHRDIKLENILLDEQNTLKLIDFGLAAFFQPGKTLKVHCGSPSYAAPEIVGRKHYEAAPVDVWSLGVVLFATICGFLPFHASGGNKQDLCNKILTGSFSCPDYMSPGAKDLLHRMLTVDPVKRITLDQIMEHPWVQSGPQWKCPSTHVFSVERDPITGSVVADEEVLSTLEAANYDRNLTISCLLNGAANYVTASYYLLKEQKEDIARKQAVKKARRWSTSSYATGPPGAGGGDAAPDFKAFYAKQVAAGAGAY